MRNHYPKAKPAIHGWVCAQYRTVKGKKYGPYWFRFYYDRGKLRKRYVRPEELDEVRRLCEEWKDRRDRGRQTRRKIASLSRHTRLLCKVVDMYVKARRPGYKPTAKDYAFAESLPYKMIDMGLSDAQTEAVRLRRIKDLSGT